MTEKKQNDVRFMYFTDPKCAERTVTLAREIVDGKLHIAWAVNKVSVEEYTQERHYTPKHSKRSVYYMQKVRAVNVFDIFSKVTARKICRGRLDAGRAVELPLVTGKPIIHQMLEAIGVEQGLSLLPWVNSDFLYTEEKVMPDGTIKDVPCVAVPQMVSRVVRDSRAHWVAYRQTLKTTVQSPVMTASN